MSAALHNMPVITSRSIRDKIVRFLAAKQAKADAEKEMNTVKPDLLDAMAGAPTAICGPYSLNKTLRQGSAAKLELANGRKLALSDIREFVLHDGTTVKGIHIVKVAGERAPAEVFEVKAH